jgi:hypothetical protein
MHEALAAYLADAAGRRFAYGSFDCFLFAADWCVRARGIDPARDIRGRYATFEQGLELVGVKSLPMGFQRVFQRAGLRLTRQPMPGDVALIQMAGVDACGALVTSAGYVALARGGGLSRLPPDRARLIAAWKIA